MIENLGYSHHDKKGNRIYFVKCSFCQKEFLGRHRTILFNKSCGCMNQVTHGEWRNKKSTPELKCYNHIIYRCGNPNSADYKNYGGRGIKVSDDWLASYQNFLRDMGRRPTPTSTIERIDVNGNYCKENCVWLEKVLQNKNTRRSRYITYENETLIVSDLLKKYDVSKTCFYRALKRGLSEIDAINTYRKK